ncbi:hypothetical protein [Streptomyces lunalinharesii]|uniref:Transposase n=1 Tax=Streptomyces lunalinharesii TaxID=333384 RepID=A0ABN3RAU2_9ACTN
MTAWTWSDGSWALHRYDIYLRWLATASEQLAAAEIGWPKNSPGLLEVAFVTGAWDPAA